MLTGTNLKYTKAYNRRIVLETIRLFGPLSRADVARRTALTPQTVSNIVKKLLEGRLVREAEKRREGRGAPSTMLEIHPPGAYSIGLDLDRDHLTGVLLDLSGAVRQRLHYELNFPSPEEAVNLMVEATETLLAQQELALNQVSGIGIGLPGPVEMTKDNRVINAVNPEAFPGWRHVPLVDLLQEHVDLPVFLENSATAAAVGERWYGAGQHIDTFFYVLFGASLGGGLILNGQPFEGYTGNAGELGYVPELDAAVSDSTSRHWDERFHLPTLYAILREQGAEVSTPDDLLRLFRLKNSHLRSWLRQTAGHLAPLLVAIECLIDPQAIFFGGRLPAPLILDLMARLEGLLPALRVGGKTSVPRLYCATAGVDAAALGVATLPMYDLFAPAPRVLMKRTH